jgi:hypothetical protein
LVKSKEGSKKLISVTSITAKQALARRIIKKVWDVEDLVLLELDLRRKENWVPILLGV